MYWIKQSSLRGLNKQTYIYIYIYLKNVTRLNIIHQLDQQFQDAKGIVILTLDWWFCFDNRKSNGTYSKTINVLTTFFISYKNSVKLS